LDECIFIDDREDYIEGAQGVGMETILYKDFESFKKELSGLL
jgi:FMN phosphatase YigB (HAD superfamily)